MFECRGDHSVVARALDALDFACGVGRFVTGSGLEEVARLGPGQSYECGVITDKSPEGPAVYVRWTHAEEG